jgi:hypothetical protein
MGNEEIHHQILRLCCGLWFVERLRPSPVARRRRDNEDKRQTSKQWA